MSKNLNPVIAIGAVIIGVGSLGYCVYTKNKCNKLIAHYQEKQQESNHKILKYQHNCDEQNSKIRERDQKIVSLSQQVLNISKALDESDCLLSHYVKTYGTQKSELSTETLPTFEFDSLLKNKEDDYEII